MDITFVSLAINALFCNYVVELVKLKDLLHPGRQDTQSSCVRLAWLGKEKSPGRSKPDIQVSQRPTNCERGSITQVDACVVLNINKLQVSSRQGKQSEVEWLGV